MAIADEGWIRARRFRGPGPGAIDQALITARIEVAARSRVTLGLCETGPTRPTAQGSGSARVDGERAARSPRCFRLVNGENDDVPGVRVDVWGGSVVISLDSPSLTALVPALVAAVRATLPAIGSVHVGWRPDSRDGRAWPAPPGCCRSASRR